MWLQRTIRFEPRPRGIHLVTGEVLAALPELGDFEVGMLHLLIQHTSASLTLSENASPEVRADLDAWLDRAVPEGALYWTHTLEGDDDMPAHVKAALMGPSLTLPLREKGDYLPNLPVPVKPVGRLDFYSEGVLLLTTVETALTFLRVPAEWVPAVQGGLILVAVLGDALRRR